MSNLDAARRDAANQARTGASAPTHQPGSSWQVRETAQATFNQTKRS